MVLRTTNNGKSEAYCYAQEKKLITTTTTSGSGGSGGGGHNISFEDSYILKDEINSGAFGVVYETIKKSDPHEILAVKVIERRSNSEERLVIEEVSILRDLTKARVPHCIHLIDFRMSTSQMFIIQQLATGGDVYDRIISKECYDEHDGRTLARNLLSAVSKMHQFGIVHRDLKPENLLLKDNTDDTKILLCDFGEAKTLPNDGSGLLSLCGTPQYAAPEMIEGKPYREECDMWSIGCLLFFVLSGTMPFGNSEDCHEIFELAIEEDYDFDDDVWDCVSGSAKKLIKNLIKANLNKRWTATDAMECNWFAKEHSALFDDAGAVSTHHDHLQTFEDSVLQIANFKDFIPMSKEDESDTESVTDDDDDDDSDSEHAEHFMPIGKKLQQKQKHQKQKTTKDGIPCYTLKQLQKKSISGLDYKNCEKYLNDKEFKKVFNNATREEVATWKRFNVGKFKRKYNIWYLC